MSMEHADISREESDPRMVPNLPSWVSDFSMRGTPRYYPWWMYSAGGTTALEAKPEMFTNGGTSLHPSGFVFGTVTSKWPVPDLRPHVSSLAAFADVERKLFSRPFAADYEKSAARLLGVQRTICFDLAYKFDVDAITGYIWKRWDGLPGFTDIAKLCFEGSVNSSETRYTTNVDPKDTDVVLTLPRGHIGLGREHVQCGDVAVIFPGVWVPFIMRSRPGTTTYQMIGPTYLDGMVDDKAMEALARGDFTLRTFEID